MCRTSLPGIQTTKRSDAMNTPSRKRANKWTKQPTEDLAKKPTYLRIGRAAAIAALALGFSVGGFAQVSQGSQDGLGGSTADMANTGDANDGALPQIERQGGVE